MWSSTPPGYILVGVLIENIVLEGPTVQSVLWKAYRTVNLCVSLSKAFRIKVFGSLTWSLYSFFEGHPALIGRHGPFAVTEQAAVRWMEHMEAALETTPEIDADSKKRMSNFFRYAYFSRFTILQCVCFCTGRYIKYSDLVWH